MMERSVEYFKTLLDTVLFSLIEIDQSGKIHYANTGIKNTTGFSIEEFLTQNFYQLIFDEDKNEFAKTLSSITNIADRVLLQYRLRHSTGVWRWVESSIRKTNNETFILETHDITHRKFTEESLQESLEWLTSVMDAFRDAVFIEENEHVVFVNKAFAKLYGYNSTSEIVGRSVTEFQAPEDSKKMLEYSRIRVEGEYAPQVYQFFGKKKDGNYVLLEASVSTLNIENRKIIITVLHDLSDPVLL